MFKKSTGMMIAGGAVMLAGTAAMTAALVSKKNTPAKQIKKFIKKSGVIDGIMGMF